MPAKKNPVGIAWLFLPTAIVLAAQGAQAQLTSTLDSNVQGRERQRKISVPPFPTSKLSKAVDLPDIPEYPKSHKFVGGDACQMTTGVSYNQTFSVNEDGQAVLDWYAQALQSFGWQNIQPSPHNVSAKKQGSSCNISASSDFTAKGRTLVSISYFAGSQR